MSPSLFYGYPHHAPSRLSPDIDPAAGDPPAEGGKEPNKEGASRDAEDLKTTRAELEATRKERDSLRGERDTFKQERDTFKTDWDHAQNLLREDGVAPEQLETSTRHVMKRAGYPEETINKYIAAAKKGAGGEGRRGKEAGEDDGEGANPADDRFEKIEEQVKDLKQDQVRDKRTYLEGLLNTSVRELTKAERVSSVLERVKDSLPSTASGEQVTQRVSQAKATLASRIRKDSLERLAVRRQQNQGRWDDKWIEEETAKAAEAVCGEYESFLADPSKIGPAPGVEPWEQQIKATKPVAAPRYAKGMTPEDAGVQAQKFAVDQLLRGASAQNRAGRSAV